MKLCRMLSVCLLPAFLLSGCAGNKDCTLKLEKTEGFSWTWTVENPEDPPLCLWFQMADYEETPDSTLDQIRLQLSSGLSDLEARLEETGLYMEVHGKDWSNFSDHPDMIPSGYSYIQSLDDQKLAVGEQTPILVFHYGHPLTDDDRNVDHSQCRKLMAAFLELEAGGERGRP
ncbi:hypothetical protein [Faecalibaculum rodentium]|uniref:Uncharacterized protein n=1 Tax=Faecalibaculum rodentium TaxID=1702221 RepID=A0A140DU17_9FIRM|nr:hypothetical protein [Faecalibaculum rodentium]AMK54144.1 hypothetical protein AALO17_10100 [Faecalibaculum rodentium]